MAETRAAGGRDAPRRVMERSGRGRARDRKALAPEEPWRWSGQWDDSRLRSSGRAGVLLTWGLALFWNALTAPLLFQFFPEEVLGRGRWGAGAIAAAFPLVGLGLLVWAVRATLQQRRFGTSVLELARVPGVLGGELVATLHTGAALGEARELRLGLACIRQTVSGTGRNRSTRESILWADESLRALASAPRGPEGLAIPVSFCLPADLPGSDPLPSDDRVLWRLEAHATLSGVDYDATFEVPVFATPETRPERTAAALARERAAPLVPGLEPVAGVRVTPHPAGGMEVFFPAGRHVPQALLGAVIAAALAGGGLAARAHGVPAPIVWGCWGMAALVGLGALELAAGSLRVVARGDGLRIQRRLFGLGRTRAIPRDEVDAVEVVTGLQAGQRVFWDLGLRRRWRSGRLRTRIGGALRERRDAERLAVVVREALGLD